MEYLSKFIEPSDGHLGYILNAFLFLVGQFLTGP
jgi:hypothetical protein